MRVRQHIQRRGIFCPPRHHPAGLSQHPQQISHHGDTQARNRARDTDPFVAYRVVNAAQKLGHGQAAAFTIALRNS